MDNEPKILLVEDNPINQEAFRITLGKLGFKADVAKSGEEALTMFTRKKYNLVFMDFYLQGMNGVETTKSLKKIAENIRIIGITSLEEEKDIKECINSGMVDVLIKPVNYKKLKDITDKFLKNAS